MSTIRYLAYGSNLLPARIEARLEDCRSLGSVRLDGWQLCFHKLGADGSGKCNLIEDPSSVAYGAVYELSQSSKERLDSIEGVGNGYRDAEIELDQYGPAWVYLAESSHIADGLIPYDWYHAFVLYGAKYHDFPSDYIFDINRVTSAPDHDGTRRAENLAILESNQKR